MNYFIKYNIGYRKYKKLMETNDVTIRDANVSKLLIL